MKYKDDDAPNRMNWIAFLKRNKLAVIAVLTLLVIFWQLGKDDEGQKSNSDFGRKGLKSADEVNAQECKKCPSCEFSCPGCENGRPIVQTRDAENGLHQYSRYALEPIDPRPLLGYDEDRDQRIEKQIKLLSILRLPQDVRRVYIDLGSAHCNGTIVRWFLNTYPEAKQFEMYAVEGHPDWKASFDSTCLAHGVKFLSAAVYISDGDEIPVEGVKVKTFDLAKWLKTIVKREDFVLVRMDIGGYEPKVMAHLKEQGALDLIDELYLECHYFGWTSKKKESTREKCVDLFYSLRNDGLYVHEWL